MKPLQEIAENAEVEATLAGAGLLSAVSTGPLLLAKGSPWRIIWCNSKAARILGTSDISELTRMCLSGAEPGARQLSRVADRMDATNESTDLRLRLRLSGGLQMLSMSCRKLPGSAPYLAISPWGYVPEAEVLPAASQPENTAAQVQPRTAGDAAAVLAKIMQPQETPAVEALAQPTEPAASGSERISPAPQQHVVDRRGNVRFLWRTDKNGLLISITGGLCESVGCDSGQLLDQNFAATLAHLGIDRDGRIGEALGRQDTWSGIEVLWPMANTSKAAPVVLGALPGFDRARAFDGFSGFGVIHLDRIADAPIAAPLAPPVSAQSANVSATSPTPAEVSPAAGELNDEIAADMAESHALADEEDGSVEDLPAVAHEVDVAAHQARHDETPLESDEPTRISNAVDALEVGAHETPEDQPHGDASATQAQENADTPVTPAQSGEGGHAATETSPPRVNAAPENNVVHNHHGNVVPIRSWQKEQRSTFAVTEAPTFRKNGLADLTDPPVAPAPDKDGAKNSAPSAESKATQDGPSQPVNGSTAARNEDLVSLSPAERNAFREIARALGARNSEKTAANARESKRELNDTGDQLETTGSISLDPVDSASPLAAMASSGAAASKIDERDTEDASNTLRLIEKLDAGVLVSRGGVPAFVNKALLDMLGYSSIDEFHKSGGLDRMFRGRDPDIMSRDADGGAIPVISGNGEVLALEGRFQTIEWDRQPATLMTFRRTLGPELNARIRALELELRQRETESREANSILDTATDGVVLVDEDGRIRTLNKSGQALFGYEQNEVAGEPLTVLLARESQALAMDYLDGLKSNGVKSVLNDGREITGRASQGGTIPLFMTLGRAGSSTPARYCAVLRDLTQWKNVERDLSDAKRDAERASSLKSDFLAKISHEIRTPLNAILGFAEVIMDERFGPVGNERYKDYLKDIYSSGTHVLSLVNDLLDLSKIEAGKLDLDFGSVNANKIVNECVSLIQPQATRERIIVRLSLAPRLPNIVADERSLRQIVLNLLSNAVKFNEPGGQVIVSTALTDAGHAVIRIRDTGIGMNDKDMELALEPFRQVATSRKTSGTGLGLPLTKALVEANRASFTIKSRKGEGTMVEVSFPQTRVLAE